VWKSLGFKNSPYDSNPLQVSESDVELLVGRDEESVKFSTLLESRHEGICIFSGPPGVGKTSFLNVQQSLLELGKTSGPRLLAARRLCPIQPNDTVRDVGLRALHALHHNVVQFCAANKMDIPKRTKTIGQWLGGKGGDAFSFGLEILGFGGSYGREVQLPSVTNVTFEGIQDALTAIVSEIVVELKMDGVFVVLDNVENLEDKQLADLLITFRDTLFSIPRVWWVVIGQSGLASLIQALDPRVSERISGSGFEFSPISLGELETAIERRVARFHQKGGGKAPLPSSVHKHLYSASHGEIRFVLKYSDSICTRFVTKIRLTALERLKKDMPQRKLDEVEKLYDEAVGKVLTQNQIPAELAETTLKEIVAGEIDGLALKPKEKGILYRIGKAGGARAKDHAAYGVKTMQDFSSNYLSKLFNQHLLARQQAGRAVRYTLRGISLMAQEFGLLAD
jgi:Cdc6-like AAA superfamily ATPase